jgi:hypothetical protein
MSINVGFLKASRCCGGQQTVGRSSEQPVAFGFPEPLGSGMQLVSYECRRAEPVRVSEQEPHCGLLAGGG